MKKYFKEMQGRTDKHPSILSVPATDQMEPTGHLRARPCISSQLKGSLLSMKQVTSTSDL